MRLFHAFFEGYDMYEMYDRMTERCITFLMDVILFTIEIKLYYNSQSHVNLLHPMYASYSY